MGLSDAHAKDKVVVQASVGQVHRTALVYAVEDLLVDLVAAAMAEANQVQRGGGRQLEVFVGLHPRGKFLGQLNVAPDVMLQAFDSVMANHEPEFQRAESPSELDVPIAVIDHRA